MTTPNKKRAESMADRLLESLDTVGETVLTRRRTLQIGMGVAAGSIVASKVPFIRDMVGLGTAEATAIPSTVVLVYLDGGNDGLNTLVPLTDGRYHDYRGSLAIQGNTTLPINLDYGLHPSLPFTHSMWAAGKAAFVRGVGYANNNLSHFTSVDHWHAGYGAVNSPVVAAPHTGWVGRFADTIGPSNPFSAVAIGPHTPVSMRGNSVAALQIPIPQAQLFGANQSDLNERWVADALRSINTAGTGTGTLGTSLASRAVSAINAAPQVSTCWTGVDGTSINRQMAMAANLINAGLGVRVISVGFDGFDTHAQQPITHARLLGDLDTALATFFQRLNPTLSRSVVVMTYSEFGRRVRANNSAGTDHGSSSIGMVFGANVAGGIYGEEPGLGTFDADGNTLVTTDFRRMYSTMLAGWLGVNPDPILGAAHVPLPLFSAQPGVVPPAASTRAPAAPASPSTLVPTTRGAAPDSPTVTTPGRVAAPPAGPGTTSTTTAPLAAGQLIESTVVPALLSTGLATQFSDEPSPGVIVPAELVVPGNGAVVAPSPTTPGETVLVAVGPRPASDSVVADVVADLSGSAPTNLPVPLSVPATAPSDVATAPVLTLVVRSQSGSISASVANGPLRNDTRVELIDKRRPNRPVAVRYLNNRTRPGIVTRTSGSVTFTGLPKGTYTVRVYAHGHSKFASEQVLSVR